tara:strand:- start:26874 stop:27857 length:984 start_codon:yes stop_codon:yes gene_type:complete
MEYKAYYVEENDGVFSSSIKELEIPDPNDGELLVSVSFSSLNYKDALCAKGVKGVAAFYPFVPGIDAVGTVAKSKSDEFKEGDKVICSGYKLGMNVNGGFGSCICVPSDWVVPLPTSMSDFEAMSYGVAGLTSAACIKSILDKGVTDTLPMAVSGVTGGVGSVAAGILNKIGFSVTAITGKSSEESFLQQIGCEQILNRDEFLEGGVRPLDKTAFGGGVDTVGGDILAKILSQTAQKGSVACCGNVAGASFQSSVFPFILRGISLLGIDSAESSIELKKYLWEMLAGEWKLDLSAQTKTIQLNELDFEIDKILDGLQIGRVVIKHGD